jgi:hypothetical protein
MEQLIDIEDGLDVVVAGSDVGEGLSRIAEGLRVEHDGLAGGEVVDVDAEALRREVVFAELEAWLAVVIFCEDENEVPVELSFGRDSDLNALGL